MLPLATSLQGWTVAQIVAGTDIACHKVESSCELKLTGLRHLHCCDAAADKMQAASLRPGPAQIPMSGTQQAQARESPKASALITAACQAVHVNEPPVCHQKAAKACAPRAPQLTPVLCL